VRVTFDGSCGMFEKGGSKKMKSCGNGNQEMSILNRIRRGGD